MGSSQPPSVSLSEADWRLTLWRWAPPTTMERASSVTLFVSLYVCLSATLTLKLHSPEGATVAWWWLIVSAHRGDTLVVCRCVVNTEDRCKLFCRVSSSSAYYQLAERVVDGTKCGPDTTDVCVMGQCRVRTHWHYALQQLASSANVLKSF